MGFKMERSVRSFNFLLEGPAAFFRAFQHHYALLVAVPFMAGILSARLYLHGAWITGSLIPLLTILFYVAGVRTAQLKLRYLAFLAPLIPGFLLCTMATINPSTGPFMEFEDEKVVLLEAIVSGDPYLKGEKQVAECRVIRLSEKSIKGSVLLSVPLPSSLVYGDRVRVSGRIRIPPGRRNPGEFNYRDYLHARGIGALFYADREGVEVLGRGEGNPFMQRAVIPLRKYIRATAERTVGDNAYLTLGILLGERRDMPEEVMQDFRNTGLMHLLAVSGLNVGMLLLIFYQLFTALFIPHKPKIILLVATVWLYAAVTDMTPSVVRATLMGTVIILSWLAERKTSVYNSIAVSALILLLVKPLYLFDLGFQLSYAATISLVYFHGRIKAWIPGFEKWPAWLRGLSDSILLSVAAMIATLPVLAFSFNQIAWISVFANLPMVPLSFAMLAGGLMLVFLGPVPFLGEACGAALHELTRLLVFITSLFADFPAGAVPVASPALFLVAAYLLFMVLLAESRAGPWARRAALFVALSALALALWLPLFKQLPLAVVTFLDVGQGDCAVIELPDSKAFLIDTGPRERAFDAGRRIVAPYLRRRGLTLIGILCSHSDADHTGGLASLRAVVKSDVPVFGPDSFAQGVRRVAAGDRIRLGPEVFLDILHPRRDTAFAAGNDQSAVARLSAGHHSILFTGDIGREPEALLSGSRERLRSDVLKIAHHGSGGSSDSLFLIAAAPQLAVISVGVRNRFGHPDSAVLARLEGLRVPVLRTDRDGAIRIALFSDQRQIKTCAE